MAKAAAARGGDASTALATAIDHCAHAVALSAAANDGAPALEPFYRLHAVRLKRALALRRGAVRAGVPPPPDAITPLARHCFAQEAVAAVGAAMKRARGGGGEAAAQDADSDDDARAAPAPPPPGPTTDALAAVIKDARAALAAVTAADRYFHKARYREGRAAAALGDAPAALAAVRPLVTAAGGGYGLTTFRIAAGDVAAAAPASTQPPPPPRGGGAACHPLWGGSPPRFSPPGVAESDRGHARRVCAHVRLHARAAAAAPGGGEELAAAAAFLADRANRGGLPGLDAASRLVAGLHFAAVVDGLRTTAAGWFTHPDDAGSSQPDATAAVVASPPRRPRLKAASRPPPTPDVTAVFERAAALYGAHILWPDRGAGGGGGGGWGELVAVADAASPGGRLPPDAAPWTSDAVFGAATRGYIACLEAAGDFAALAALAARLRGRGARAARDAPRHTRAVTAEACTAAPRALASAVDALVAAADAGVAAEVAAVAVGGDGDAARAHAAEAAGVPRARAWALLRAVTDARRAPAWVGGEGYAASSSLGLDAALTRAYGGYCRLVHGAKAAGVHVSLHEAAAGADDLVRSARRAGEGGGGTRAPAASGGGGQRGGGGGGRS